MPIIENSEFENKVVVITGAGNGLGRSHAIEYAKRGAKVVVNDLGGGVDGSGAGDAADQVVAELKAMGAEAVANKASVSDPVGAESIIQSALDAFGRIDILVNNAGILRDRSFKKMTLADWDLVLQVHLSGTAYVTRAAWPHMNEQGYGRIVLTSSSSGIYGNFGQANYGAAKMGMLGLMNVLALEGAKNNVRVNTLAPAAATRMISTIPGRDIDPDSPPPESALPDDEDWSIRVSVDDGTADGTMVGALVGAVGAIVGDPVGAVGAMLGRFVGAPDVGDAVGRRVGPSVGPNVSPIAVGTVVVGDVLGLQDGTDVGSPVGDQVGVVVGEDDGAMVGDIDGVMVGEEVGEAVGEAVGDTDGDAVGATVGGALWVGDCVPRSIR